MTLCFHFKLKAVICWCTSISSAQHFATMQTPVIQCTWSLQIISQWSWLTTTSPKHLGHKCCFQATCELQADVSKATLWDAGSVLSGMWCCPADVPTVPRQTNDSCTCLLRNVQCHQSHSENVSLLNRLWQFLYNKMYHKVNITLTEFTAFI